MKDLTRVIEAGQTRRVNNGCVHGTSLDLGDPTGVAVATILAAIAAMEVEHKRNRQTAANHQRAQNDTHTGPDGPSDTNAGRTGQTAKVERFADDILKALEAAAPLVVVS